MTICLLLAVFGGLMVAVHGERIRDRFLRALVLFGVALAIITESLGAFDAIRRGPLILSWSAVLMIAVVLAVKQRFRLRLGQISLNADPIVLISSAGIIAILTLTAVTAVFSPPNSADAMAYHMPRVVYWAEESSVRFFPTQYLNQIMLQPFAEYVMLHTYVLSGGDHWINFVQWFASLASIIGVSSAARMFGAEQRIESPPFKDRRRTHAEPMGSPRLDQVTESPPDERATPRETGESRRSRETKCYSSPSFCYSPKSSFGFAARDSRNASRWPHGSGSLGREAALHVFSLTYNLPARLAP